MSKEKKNSSLIEIRDILKEEMDKFKVINDEMVDNQSDFQKINDNYNQYNSLIDKGHSHISDLTRQEYIENLFVYIGFYFFLACVFYVLHKRFPILKIFTFLLKLLYKIISFFFPHKHDKNAIIYNSIINGTNSTNSSLNDL